MNPHDTNITIGKVQMKVKIIAAALQEKNFDKANEHIARTIELLKQLQNKIKDK